MRLQSFWHFGRITFFCLDWLLLVGAVIGAYLISPRFTEPVFVAGRLNPGLYPIVLGLPFLMAAGLQLVGVQRNRAGFAGTEAIIKTFVGLFLGICAFVAISFLAAYVLIGRIVLVTALLNGTFFIVGSRLIIWKLAARTSRRTLVYGSQEAANHLVGVIQSHRLPIKVVEFPTPPSRRTEPPAEPASPFLAGYCLDHAIDDVVVEIPERLTAEERRTLLLCTGLGINVIHLSYFYEKHLEQVYVSGVREDWFWGYDPAHRHPVYFTFKRLTDIAVSLAGGVLFTALFPFIAFAIKIQDRGPVIYSQIRVGRYNKPFRIYKVRTMRMDAEKKGAQWAAANDNRVTPLGRLLRKTRLDEVPQFWNILRGEMSLIGPRPERPEMVEVIETTIPFYRYRHLIKPGLSGWAQINYRYGASIEDAAEKLSFDFYYLKYASITLDLTIIMRTVAEAMKGSR